MTMSTIRIHRGNALFIATALLTFASGLNVARAADTEAFEPQYVEERRPNVLFLVDSTNSLAPTQTSRPPDYDYTVDYSTYLKANESCAGTTAYFDASNPGTPNCGKKGVGKLPVDGNFHCDAKKDTLIQVGTLSAKVVEKIVSGGKNPTTTWVALSPSYPNAGSQGAYCQGEAGTPANAFDGVDEIQLYYGNYINYEKALPSLPPVVIATESRMDKVKDALIAISAKYKDKINVGMMRTSTTGAKQTGGAGKGGMVVFAVDSLDGTAIHATSSLGYDYSVAGLPDLAADGSIDRLDDFIWTMRDRVACKQDQDCGGAPPPVEDCGPGEDCIQVMYPNGDSKALAEMLFEAYLYYSGQDVQYGTRSAVDPTIDFDSVSESLVDPGGSTGSLTYDKPGAGECQTNYIILITDGLSSQDSSSDTDIKKMVESLPETVLTAPGSPYTVDKNGKVTFPNNSWSSNAKSPSEYIDDLAFYLNKATRTIDPKMPPLGVTTYAVGFQIAGSQDEVDATALLNDVARAGGTGQAVMANSPSVLIQSLDDIVTKILTGNTSFSAPSVTINAFNRTQNLNDLYMSVFRPEYLRRWKGNVKKYTVDPATGEIIDKNEEIAVNSTTGFFWKNSQSLWSNTYDGALAPQGGAAVNLPDSDVRTIFVDGDGTTLESLDGYLGTLSDAEKETVFDVTTASDADVLVDWLYGTDTYDEAPVGEPDPNTGLFKDGDSVTTVDKKLMGDPLHSRPAVVVYGQKTVEVDDGAGGTKTIPDKDDALVFITTNEGMLHALDSKTGVEKWAFAPKELLYRLDWLRDRGSDTETALKDRTDPRFYGIDGTVRVLRIDRKGDGPIKSSDDDHVFIFFGLRRGGTTYYGMEVTDPENPVLLWKWSLPDGAQSWSNPVVGDWVRVNIAEGDYGSKNGFNNGKAENRYAVVIGGGFDPTNDTLGFAKDGRGNKVYMLDVATGNVLWSAGPSNSSADLELTRMEHSIVADVRVVDLSGDNFADRMYAADLGGQVWRFDINNGEKRADLVTGGVMADVGSQAANRDRRFFYAPDVAEVRCGGKVFYNVAIGSGDRENPVSDQTTQNTFFSFRDTLTRTKVDTDNYKTNCSNSTDPCFELITDDDRLVDATTTASPTVGANATGWKMDLVKVGGTPEAPTRTGRGEKVLAESRTFANGVYFTSYAPENREVGDCGTYVGINRLYVVSACNAAPVNNFDTSTAGANSVADRTLQLAQGSIAPEVVFIFPTPPEGCNSRDCLPPPQCLVGLANCGRGVANNPVRVFWREQGAE
jgi:type IV pilus assembly protein PilY1